MGSFVSFQKGSNTIAGHASFPNSMRREEVGPCGHQNKISQVVSAGKLEWGVTAQLAVVSYRSAPQQGGLLSRLRFSSAVSRGSMRWRSRLERHLRRAAPDE